MEGMRYLLRQFSGGSQDERLTFFAANVELFEGGNGESGGLAGSRLRLGDHVTSLDTRNNGALLNSRRLFKTISVDT